MTFRRCLVGVASILFFVAAGAGPASAHAIVESTEPAIDEVVRASPERVVMRFNEPVEIAFGAVRVYDTNARRVDAGDAGHIEGRPDAISVPLEENLDPGTYTVTWRVLSADSHVIQEAFVFHVETPGARSEGIAEEILGGAAGAGGTEAVLFGFVRWASFAALLLLAGAALFVVLVWQSSAGLARAPEIEAGFSRRWRRLVRWSFVAAVLSAVAAYILQGAVAGDLPMTDAASPSVLSEVLTTRFGKAILLRLVLLGGLAGVYFAARSRGDVPVLRDTPARASAGAAGAIAAVPRWAMIAGGILVAAMLMTPGLAGHPGTTPPVALNLVADLLHMLGAAVWLGGLTLLLTAAFPATRGLDETERARVLAPVVGRFSQIALVAVGVLVASGAYRGWVEIRALRGLTDTSYGIVFLTKMAVFVPLLALGAINFRWSTPRIKRAAEGGGPGPLGVLKRLVGAETALIAVVLAVTALLVNLAPARVSAGIEGPFVTDVALGENELNVLVDPNEVGENFVHLTLTSPEGRAVEVRAMRVLFRMPEQDIGPLIGKGRKLATGHFVVQGNQLSVPGQWSLEVVVRLDRFTEERTRVGVTVNR
ncbi:MAG: copper resistance CopC/CopD family protein [Actinomycetota bacterium]